MATTLHKRRVVITGLGVVSPNGIGAQAFWQSVRDGVSGVDVIHSFDAEGLPCRVAAEVNGFEAEEHLPARDLKRVGRSVPMAIAAAEEVFGSGHVDPTTMTLDDKRSLGIVLGSGGGTPDFTESQYQLFYSNRQQKTSAYNISSSTMGSLSSEISLRFDLRGQSHVISTGCTSSTDAMGYAFNQIRFGLAQRLISGGVDATITPAIMKGFCIMRVLSVSHNDAPKRASRPFDGQRDGFVLGEGAWLFMFEEREHALQRNAPIYAEVLGYASTCDAYHRVQLDPTGEEPARAMCMAVADAGVAKDEIGYIALHGTATRLNDRTETAAVKRAFGKRAYDIPMSSIKSMIGHPQGASGAAGAAAAVLGMRASFLPPTINYEHSDPECDLGYIPNIGIEKEVEVALCNCIGFGSKNSALVIARHPRKASDVSH